MARPAVFFDRDNTLIANSDYLGDPDGVVLIPGAADAVSRVRAMGFITVVVSNQSGVARGMFGEDDVRAVNFRMNAMLVELHPDAVIDHHEFCPYHPQGTMPEFALDHPRRKPQPGMLLDAAETLELDLGRSWLIGDAPRDVEAGWRAGCRTILVKHALDSESPAANETLEHEPDYVASSLEDAVDFIEMQLAESAAARPLAEVASDTPIRDDVEESTSLFETQSPRVGFRQTIDTRPIDTDTVDADIVDRHDDVPQADAETIDAEIVATEVEELPPSPPPVVEPVRSNPLPPASAPSSAPPVAPVSSHLGVMQAAIAESAPPASTDKHTVLLLERVLEELRRANDPPQEFSVAKMLGGIVQGFAIALLMAALIFRGEPNTFMVLIGIAIFLQALVTSLVLMGR